MAWILTMVEPPPSKHVSGKALYARECSMCHGADLSGTPPQVPSLKSVSDRYTDSELTTLLSQATGRMPSFERLGDEANSAIVRFITTGEDVRVSSADHSTADMKYVSDGYKKFLDPDGYPAIAPPWGTLNALNVDTGRYAWRIPFGEYPALTEQGLRNTGSENYGGPVVTAGGLVFIGATSYDRKMHAFDKLSGTLLWEATLPAAGNATPATYEVNGRQFVVIAAGGGKSKDPSGGSYVAYALPD
jgi:quinoprotein glucose dehydrogenase